MEDDSELSAWKDVDNFLCRQCAFHGETYDMEAALQRLRVAWVGGRALACATTEKLLLVTHKVKLPAFRTSPSQPGKQDDNAVKVLRMLSPSMLNDHTPLSVVGDGNCMYRALSRGLFGTENHHLHVRLLTALEIMQNRKFYDVSSKEYVDLVRDSRVFHDCYDSIVKSTTVPRQYSEMLHIFAASAALSVCVNCYCPPQPRGANFEADTLSRIVNGRAVATNAHRVMVMWTGSIPTNMDEYFPNHFVTMYQHAVVPQQSSTTSLRALPLVHVSNGASTLTASSSLSVPPVAAATHTTAPTRPLPLVAAATHTTAPTRPLPLVAAATHTTAPTRPLPLVAAATHTTAPTRPLPPVAAATHTTAPTRPLPPVAAATHTTAPTRPLPLVAAATHTTAPTRPLPLVAAATHSTAPTRPLPPVAAATHTTAPTRPLPPVAAATHSTAPTRPLPPVAAATHTTAPTRPLPLVAAATHTTAPTRPLPLVAAATHSTAPIRPLPPVAAATHTTAPTRPLPPVAAAFHNRPSTYVLLPPTSSATHTTAPTRPLPPTASTTATTSATTSSSSTSVPDISLIAPMPHTPFHVPVPVVEPDIDVMEAPTAEPSQIPELNFTMVEKGSKSGKRQLVDSLNHTYNKKRCTKNATVWQCSIRYGLTYCVATVKQCGEVFTPGPSQHVCLPKASALAASRIRAQLGSTIDQISTASTIVNAALRDHLPTSAPTEALPKMSSLVRMANKSRQADRPTNPTTLNFNIQQEAIPDDFLKADLQVGQRRHLIFYTATLMSLLRVAKEWYVDGTFKAVGAPFTQLWTIHVFLKSGDCVKQVPLVFALMSGKSTDDYVAVLRHVVEHLHAPLAVVTVVLDFEAALWSALRQVLPEVSIKGCHFHWTQAIWRKVQDVNLAMPYMQDSKTQKFIRRLFCLPFLPQEQMCAYFATIMALGTPTSPLPEAFRQLLNYIDNTWIHSAIWPPASWSVFNRSVRTNNDCEGWHRRLNSMTRRNHLPFYQLVTLLHGEAILVNVQMQFIADEKLQRLQRVQRQQQQGKIFMVWDAYINLRLDAHELMAKIGKIYKPCIRVTKSSG